MASIQQSLNALIGTGTAAATMGAYMYRQSPTYKANQIEKAAKGEAAMANARNIFRDAEGLSTEAELKKIDKTPIVSPMKEDAIRDNQINLEANEIRAKGAEDAFLASPTPRRIGKWIEAEKERFKFEREAAVLQRQQERLEELRGIRKGLDERKETLKWQRNLGEALDAPGDRSHDRMKLATITRDVKFKEKNKGETE